MDIERDLFEEMKKDRIVIDYLADRSIATDFYMALSNVVWYPKKPSIPEEEQIISKLRGDPGEPGWGCSWRAAGAYIAEIRNMHYISVNQEDYMDFYCSGEEGTITDLVRECFDRMGWIPYIYGDDE